MCFQWLTLFLGQRADFYTLALGISTRVIVGEPNSFSQLKNQHLITFVQVASVLYDIRSPCFKTNESKDNYFGYLFCFILDVKILLTSNLLSWHQGHGFLMSCGRIIPNRQSQSGSLQTMVILGGALQKRVLFAVFRLQRAGLGMLGLAASKTGIKSKQSYIVILERWQLNSFEILKDWKGDMNPKTKL